MAAPSFEDVYVLEQTDEKPSAAFIYLHGTGKCGKDARDSFIDYLGAPGHRYIKFYFPTAPQRYLTIRDTVTTYWFDVIRTGPESNDLEGNVEHGGEVSQMFEKKIQEIVEEDGIPRERIIIGGTSQGGIISMYAGYVQGVKCGAVVGLSASFPFSDEVKYKQGVTTPLLSVYGQKDAMIQPEVMSQVWQSFRKWKVPLTVKSLLRNGHTMDAQYAKVMFQWLEKMFPPVE